MDQRSHTLIATADAAAKAAIKALSALEDGPGKDVLRKVEQAAANDPNGFRGVIASMHPGGRNEELRTEYNAVIAKNPAFATALSRAGAGLENYAAARGAAVADYQKRGWDLATLDARLRAYDRTIAEAAERIPGRKSGKSLYDELSDRAAELVRNLIQRVRSFFGGDDPHAKPAQTVRPKQSIAM
jgi:hypothetical protein